MDWKVESSVFVSFLAGSRGMEETVEVCCFSPLAFRNSDLLFELPFDYTTQLFGNGVGVFVSAQFVAAAVPRWVRACSEYGARERATACRSSGVARRSL
jgi:hypothetical protein